MFLHLLAIVFRLNRDMHLRQLVSSLVFLFTLFPLRGVEPEQLSPVFRQKMIEAINAYRAKDLKTAKARIDEAEKIQPGTTAAANMSGAIAMELEQYEAAKTDFERALAIDPTFFPAQFNLTEIPFQQKKYAEARTMLEALAPLDSDGKELVEYKVFLTYLLEGQNDVAAKRLEAIKFPSDTPAYYFAHAAWEFAHDNRNEAQSWVQSSSRIFKPHQNAIFAETLEELGWLTRKASVTSEVKGAE